MTDQSKLVCALPPPGWQCSRDPGHAGPCAASQIPGRNLKPVHISSPTYSGYKDSLYKEQREIASKWMEEHDREKHILAGETFRYAGAIGGTYTWCYTGTSLGQVVTIRCACGESVDVSDYDQW